MGDAINLGTPRGSENRLSYIRALLLYTFVCTCFFPRYKFIDFGCFCEVDQRLESYQGSSDLGLTVDAICNESCAPNADSLDAFTRGKRKR